MNSTDRYPWGLFFLLLGASLIGVIAIMPYALELSRDTLQKLPLPLPLPVVLALQFIQNAILLGVATGVGLLVSRKVGLGAPVLEAWLYKRVNLLTLRMFAASALAGAAVAALIVVLVHILFLLRIPQLALHNQAAIALWKRFLACFYGALDEEILMRLFLLSLVLWLIGKFWRTARGQPSPRAFWTSNFFVALLFGLGHMPAAALVMPINMTTTLYILSLNGVASLLFGYLFWRHGLESAMIAHFSADIVLHVIAPALTR